MPDAGAALAAARRVHCVGVGGSGMSSLALLLHGLGKHVTGCDRGTGATVAALRRAGIAVLAGHSAEHLGQTDLVVRSAAVAADTPEVAAARGRGLAVLTHAEALGALMAERVGYGVAGTHGKTTTTAMLAWVLAEAGLDPTLALGGESVDFGSSARVGRGQVLVAEADEFDRRFLHLHPAVAIITNIEADHLDYYRDLDEIVGAFRAFVAGLPPHGLVVTCADSATLDALELSRRRERYGFAAGADWRIGAYAARRGGGCEFEVSEPGGARERLTLLLNGRHNAANATAVLAASRAAGVTAEQARRALAAFRGARRRFEALGEAGGARVVDDYAHHPTELRATLAAARGMHPGRIVAAFQPHTTNRTAHLFAEFAASFGDADLVVLLPIYQPAGREQEARPVTAQDLAAAIQGPPVEVAAGLDDAVERLARLARPGDLILTLGAGDVTVVGPRLLARLAGGGAA